MEMIVAKYRSMRLAVADALSILLDDESSALHGDGLPPASRHAATLAIDALKTLLEKVGAR